MALVDIAVQVTASIFGGTATLITALSYAYVRVCNARDHRALTLWRIATGAVLAPECAWAACVDCRDLVSQASSTDREQEKHV